MFRLFLLFLLLAILLLCGCTRTPPQQHGLKQIAVASPLPRDDLGREIKLKSTPRRIVTIGPGATETVFALSVGNRLVGRDQISDYPPAALKVPVVGDYTGPFPEKVVALRPDFIIVQGETYDKARAELWQRKIGATVAVLTPHTVEQVVQGIEKIGKWLDAREAATKLSGKFRGFSVDTCLEGEPYVFFEVSRSPLWTAGKGTLIHDVIAKSHLVNVALSIQGYKQYSLETLLSKDPDLYIVAEKRPNKQRTLRELRRHPSLRRLRCIQKGNVIVVPADWVLRPGPRLVNGIKALERATLHFKPKPRH